MHKNNRANSKEFIYKVGYTGLLNPREPRSSESSALVDQRSAKTSQQQYTQAFVNN